MELPGLRKDVDGGHPSSRVNVGFVLRQRSGDRSGDRQRGHGHSPSYEPHQARSGQAEPVRRPQAHELEVADRQGQRRAPTTPGAGYSSGPPGPTTRHAPAPDEQQPSSPTTTPAVRDALDAGDTTPATSTPATTPSPTTPHSTPTPDPPKRTKPRKTPPATATGPLVTGRLIADVTPLPQSSSPLVRATASAVSDRPAGHERDHLAVDRDRRRAGGGRIAGPRRVARTARPPPLADRPLRVRPWHHRRRSRDLRPHHPRHRRGHLPRRQRAARAGADRRAGRACAGDLRAGQLRGRAARSPAAPLRGAVERGRAGARGAAPGRPRRARRRRSAASPKARRWRGTLAFIVEHARTDGSDHEINKALADFDFDSQRRLGAHAAAGPGRPGARADGHADPAVARAHRSRERQHRGAEPRTSGSRSA